MSFHEKSAWAMAVILLAGLGWYVRTIAGMSAGMEQLAPPVLPVVIAYIVVIVILSIVGHVLIAVAKPSEADDMMDERDKLIAARAGNVSGVLLGVGVLAALGAYLFTYDGNLLFHAAFLALMVSQIAEYGARIVYYRGGV
ncbi:hypothetical protein [Henriciella pelagia]|jgi:hypothetical protein|uniref:DUF2178 domain-containing protein n=1 Tax=Henriciella pelagia TaxID=1977912 RepID=A0ABQ1JEJ0_9PROT|nr:hypothetical protein [Henriciella pelagia]GGB66387.1 hypothetical protein GCM10011503_13980 [Henriciella pelagia]